MAKHLGSTRRASLLVALLVGMTGSAWAAAFHFDSGGPTNDIAVATQPSTAAVEIEAGDDFLLASPTNLTHATFTGLLPVGTAVSSITQVVVEIYRVFPVDSTSPPSATVPTRVNSPSDVAFATRDSALSQLTYAASVLNATFTANNSVQSGGIHPFPNQTTGGNGPVTGPEVAIDVTIPSPISLPAGHYFFVPQVLLTSGEFRWLSGTRPITGAGSTPFSPDLQSWIRDANLSPNWLRIGTDIVGGATPPTYNQAFTLDGETLGFDPTVVPTLSVTGLAALAALLVSAGWIVTRRRRGLR